MEIVKLYSPYLISFFIGHFICNLALAQVRPLSLLTRLFLATGIGLGVSANLVFFSFVIFNQLNKPFCIGLNIGLLVILIMADIILRIKHKKKIFNWRSIDYTDLLPLLGMIAIAIPLWLQCQFYAYGGWDAWSTWNLKAKFLFLGGANWQNLFDPVLWRSSPHYPLLLPLTNVWGWIFFNSTPFKVPVFTSFLFAFSTAGLLFSGLRRLTGSLWAVLTAFMLLTLPIFTKLSLSQYSDIIVGYYLLASCLCLILAKNEHSSGFAFLAAMFLGLLSFSKSEGLVAALLLIILFIPFLWFKNSQSKKKTFIVFFLTLIFAFLPTILFKLIYSPGNQTFINGLTSQARPVNLWRFKTILGFYLIEMTTPLWNLANYLKEGTRATMIVTKWHGLWLIMLLGLIFSRLKSISSKLVILPCFLLIYTLTVIFYYFINTQFQIEWWLQVTLHRILYSLLPVCLLWTFYAVWLDKSR